MYDVVMTLVGGVLFIGIAISAIGGAFENHNTNKRFKEQNKHKNRKIKKKGGK